MPPSKLLDTHIHLWPSTSTHPLAHSWMTPGLPLAKRHGISDYLSATSPSPIKPSAFIYVETDRYLSSPYPDLSPSLQFSDPEVEGRLEKWAHEPLEEIRFLRRIVEGRPEDGDGFEVGDERRVKMAGCVIWAPFHLPHPLFCKYLVLAEQIAGPGLWPRVVGFRYLLQGIKTESEMRGLVGSEDWMSNILSLGKGRGGKGWTFDIGVDAHSGGVWQMDVVGDMIDRVRKLESKGEEEGKVVFVLNHLCKPSLSHSPSEPPPAYLTALTRLAQQFAVYMKLSGAFNEFAPLPTPTDIPTLLSHLSPYFSHILALFGADRIMFGSDWPVCNLGGPAGDKSWGVWRGVVEEWLVGQELREKDREMVWWGSGCRAYGVEI